MKQYNGFLYGHYDSRGGAVLVVAANREEADKAYADSYEFESYLDAEEAAEARKNIIEEDFIAPATVKAHREVGHGEDLEYTECNHGPRGGCVRQESLWVRRKHSETLQFRFVKGDRSPGPLWKRSQYGEDAMGVALATELDQI